MNAVMLRPGAAVEAVDEGLLFSGWQGSTLMVCKPGVAKVWRAMEPVVRSGFEPAALVARLPEAARGVGDVLVATLRDNGMLVPAPAGWSAEERAEVYLAHSAADPGEAAARLAGTVVTVVGRPTQVSAVRRVLRECHIHLDDVGGADQWAVFVGARDDFSVRAECVAAAVAVGDTIVVAPCDAGPERLAAALDRLTQDGTPSASAWAVARTVLIEAVHRLLAGTSRADRCFLIDASGSVDVPLAPPRRDAEPATLDVSEWRERDDTAMLSRLEPVTAERIGPFPAPNPGTLVQHPLARQTVGGVHGAGLDQARAGADAFLGALRDQVAGLGGHPVAGDGVADLIADAAGRLAVAEAADPDTPWSPTTPVAGRWVQAATRLSGRAPEISTVAAQGMIVARAAVAGRESWGYGADPETAGEHATRGLLKTLVTEDAQGGTPPSRRPIPVSHEAAAALPLLTAIRAFPDHGDRPHPEALLAAFGIRLLDLGGGLAATGVLVGIAGARS